MSTKKREKLIAPDTNIEYTFIFPNGAKHTFQYLDVAPDGRLMFLNVKTKNIVYPLLSPARFDYLYRRQLYNTRLIRANTPPNQTSVNYNDDSDAKNIKRLLDMTESEKQCFEKTSGKTVETFIEEYRQVLTSKNNLAALTNIRLFYIKQNAALTALLAK